MSPLTRRVALAGLAGLALAGAGAAFVWRQRAGAAARVADLMDRPLAPPEGAMNVFHLGHSLVGRDMPAMLAQLAGHTYDSQLGWGVPLRAHWEPEVEINGFDAENDHPRYRNARAGIGSGEYDAVILTEMVEITDAIRYHDSAKYLGLWAEYAREARPDARVYLYESWHHTNDPAGWQARLARDLPTQWQDKIAHPAMATTDVPIHLIPAGQTMGAVARAAEAGEIDGLSKRDDLFATTPEGAPDTIHFNDIGAYVVALVHYAVLYHRSPVGVPHALQRADGSAAQALSPAAAERVQQIVWEVVQRHPETGVQG